MDVKSMLEKINNSWLDVLKKIGRTGLYLLFSYVVAGVTISLIYFFKTSMFLQSAENIFFSTAACYLITTYLGIKTVDVHEKSELLTVLLIVGLVICLSFNAVTIFYEIPAVPNLIFVIISIFICLIFGYKYVSVDLAMERVLRQHNEKFLIAKAEYIKEQRKTSGTKEYFDGHEYHF